MMVSNKIMKFYYGLLIVYILFIDIKMLKYILW